MERLRARRMVTWETSARADADLVLTSLEYALAGREVAPGELVHHADHGAQYTPIKLTTRLVRAGIQASMGLVGDSCDNALAENLRMLSKAECIRGRVFATRAEANLALFEYIDGFHNPAASRNDSAASAPSSSRRSTTPASQRPDR